MTNDSDTIDKPRLPHGFSVIDGPDGQTVLVPTYMVPATKAALEVDKAKDTFNVNRGPEVNYLINSLV
jgi:hypothetical protein